MLDLTIDWSLAGPGILISEEAPVVSVLRVARDDAAASVRLGRAFNLAWPQTPNAVVEGTVRVAWMGPQQWAIFGAGADLEARVSEVFGHDLYHLSDVSAGRRLWRVQGVHSRSVVAQGCGLDTHPAVLSVRPCARTLFAQAPALLIGATDGKAFEILSDVSFVGHLRAWFAEATLEYRK